MEEIMSKYDFGLELYNDNPLAGIARTVEMAASVLEFGPANVRLTKYLNSCRK